MKRYDDGNISQHNISLTKHVTIWPKRPPTIMTEKSVKINIYFSISAPNAIFHIDQIDLLSRCHCSNFFYTRAWVRRKEWERELNMDERHEWISANDALLSGKTFLWWWIGIHWARDKIGLSSSPQRVHTTQFFIHFFIHLVSSWNWMLREREKLSANMQSSSKKVHAH